MSYRIASCLLLLATGCLTAASDDRAGGGGGGKSDIWGADDRIERYEIQTDALREAAFRAGALIQTSELELDAEHQTYSVPNVSTFAEAQNLCEGERFADQPVPAYCSGTLIAEDLVLTAGHCVAAIPCSDTSFVFDVAYDEPTLLPELAARDIPAAKVFRCAEVVASEYVGGVAEGAVDYAIIRLDRKVTDRTPATVNWSGAVEVDQPAYVVGQPMGLPQKLATGKVTATDNPAFVQHDADVFGGNSGGPLFDKHGTLIGIHVNSSGMRYIPGPSGTCNVAAVCGENAECLYPPHAYDPRAMKARLSEALRTELGIAVEP